MKIRNLIPILFAVPALLAGKIVETDNFEDLLIPYAALGKVLVVCDIDNTLLRGSQQLGSVAWSDHFFDQLIKKGIPYHEASLIESMIWQAIQPNLKVVTVDPKASAVIAKLQEQNIHVIALTARTPKEATYTFPQLVSLGIDFNYPAIAKQQLTLDNHPVLYEKGIIFATPFIKKSQALFAFLEIHGIKPSCIVFADDKLGHVQDLEKACAERSIEYYGFRFSGADPFVKDFDPLIADIQWEALPACISDEQAKKILFHTRKNFIDFESVQKEMPHTTF